MAGGLAGLLVLAAAAPAWAGFGYERSVGSPGTSPGELQGPIDVGVDGSGNVFVLDDTRLKVVEYDKTGAFVGEWGASNPAFNGPTGLAVDGSGHVWVADQDNEIVREFSATGTELLTIGTAGVTGSGTTTPSFNTPRDVAVDGSGNVFVSDHSNNRVVELTSAGVFVQVIGGSGFGDGQFNSLNSVTVDGSGHLYTTELNALFGNRVQEFATSDGSFVRKWGSTGHGDGQFWSPQGLVIADSGDVLVVESSDNRVERFSATGTYISQFGGSGSGESQFTAPYGIAYDPSLEVTYVADYGNKAVKAWGNTSSITIREDSVPDHTEDFTYTASGEGVSNFTLDDSGGVGAINSKTFSQLSPGTYSFTESTSSHLDLTAISCTGASSVDTDVPNRQLTVTLVSDDTVDCTFTNELRPSIQLFQDTVPNDGQGFQFAVSGVVGNATLTDDGGSGNFTDFQDVAAGTHVITQTAVADHPLTGISCSGASSATPDLAAGTVSIDADYGQTVVCTFTNKPGGSLTVTDDTRPDGPQDFAYTTTGTGLSDFGLDDDADPTLPNTRTFALPSGSYSVTEGSVAGFQLSALTCTSGGTSNLGTRKASITMTQGAAISCTFTNKHRQPDAMVKKAGEPDSAYALNDFYSAVATTTQTKTQTMARGATKTFKIAIQNDGAMDNFKVTGTGGGPAFTVHYLRGTTDVTGQVTSSAGLSLNGVVNGATVILTVRVTAAAGAAVGSSRSFVVKTVSKSLTTQVDVVRATTTITS